MTLRKLQNYILSDLGWFTNKRGIPLLIKILQLLITSPSFNVTFWFRIGNYLRDNNYPAPIYYVIQYICIRKKFKTGIDLPLGTKVGHGLLFAHLGCIVVNGSAIIGDYALQWKIQAKGKNLPSLTLVDELPPVEEPSPGEEEVQE